MADPNENDVERRLDASPSSAVSVVLAEADAPGSLHYLLEAEGFRVVGCASDEHELSRVLGQDLDPDVIVLDADIAATSLLVAREHAPDAHVIAIWPDDVAPPPGGERVSPRLVYEDLGPTIRRHMDKQVVPVPDVVVPSAELAVVGAATGGSGFALGRAASRLSVTSVTLLTAILLTMGVSFALGGFHSSRMEGPPRIVVPGPPATGPTETPDPITGRTPRFNESGAATQGPVDQPTGPIGHHEGTGSQGTPVTNTTGGGTTGGDPGTPADQGGNPGEQGGGSGGDQGGGSGGDQGGGSGGDQGGGSGGDQGGGSGGDQGGGSGDQGGQGNEGDQGDQGGSQGDQGDQGGSQGDQGSQSQGDQGTQGGQHAGQTDDQGN
jgi:hypothetical protein